MIVYTLIILLSEVSYVEDSFPGRIGLIVLQKCTVIVCQLTYGMTTNTIDEYLKLGKSTALECLSIIVQ
jgi:hypothetical protein